MGQSEYDNKRFDDVVRQHTWLTGHEQDYYKHYERTLVTVASGLLVFSVAFLGLFRRGGIPDPPELQCFGFLIASWALLGFAVLSALFTMLLNAFIFRMAAEKLRSCWEENREPPGDRLNLLSYVLYALAGLAFVLGLIFLLIFCGLNMGTF